MPLKIVRNDLTKMQVDAIVNTANRMPVFSSGTDFAVYHAAGVDELLRAREAIGELAEGQCAITSGFKLPASYIIHAVSPCYIDGCSGEEEKLRLCYRNALALAKKHECKSIAFPLISTGNLGYPKEEGMRIALDEILAFLLHHDMLVYVVVFDDESTRLASLISDDLEAYIDEHYVEEQLADEHPVSKIKNVLFNRSRSSRPKPSRIPFDAPMMGGAVKKESVPLDESSFLYDNESLLKERVKHVSDTFQQYLMYLIELKQLTNAEVYKNALISKQLFSKIKLNPDYHPDKATAMRLCIGAKLSLDETNDLLARAGYALSPCDKRDIIFRFFIEHGVYDMIEIDIALEEHGLPCFIE